MVSGQPTNMISSPWNVKISILYEKLPEKVSPRTGRKLSENDQLWRCIENDYTQGRRQNANWGGVYIHIFRFCPTSFFWNEVDFKRSQSGRTRIYEYTPPPPISVLATALTTPFKTLLGPKIIHSYCHSYSLFLGAQSSRRVVNLRLSAGCKKKLKLQALVSIWPRATGEVHCVHLCRV